MRSLLGIFLLVCALFRCSIFAAPPERLTASGIVVDDSTKLPIENATVMVHSAGVKSGYDQFCPTCYVDCGKRATTDAKGAFTIPGLSPDLLFNFLIVREGYSAIFVKRVDPAKGAAETAALKNRKPPENPKQIVRGKILDAKGQPVRDALISQQGIIFDMGRAFGDRDWIDPIAVSNGAGEFEMAYMKPAKAMILEVTPRGMAPKLVALPTGSETPHNVTVTDGAVIRGRLVDIKGKPVAGAEFVLSTHIRMAGRFFQDIRMGTNENGEFVVTNVPPGRVWDLFPTMDSLAPKGLTAPLAHLATRDDGEEIRMPDTVARAGYSLKGKIMLADGAAIPPGMRVNLFADGMPDRQSVLLGPDGLYEFRGLANRIYTLAPAVKGYEQKDSESQLELLIDGDRKDLNVTLYPVPARN
jgi:hypothetical protein